MAKKSNTSTVKSSPAKKAGWLLVTTNSSTLDFATYKLGPMGNLIRSSAIRVRGGAGVFDPTVSLTPETRGTVVSNDDYDCLTRNPVFTRMVANGHVKAVSLGSISYNAVKNAEAPVETILPTESSNSDMVEKDKSAQIPEEEIEDQGFEKLL